ncbi:MAG: YjfA family protein [Streptosporangiales bacterium]|nr:YjfA family protein [Streptosporangiales bacterium]
MHRITRVALTALLATPALIATQTTTASAATTTASCSGNGCDGRNPNSTGCSATAITAEEVEVVDSSSGADDGELQLRYSTACRTTWARFVAPSAQILVATIRVVRNHNQLDFQADSGGAISYSSTLGQYFDYTNMLYDGNTTSDAQINLLGSDGSQVNAMTPSF